jgi:pimeloyl-ACP methyl ester carboxylesterase
MRKVRLPKKKVFLVVGIALILFVVGIVYFNMPKHVYMYQNFVIGEEVRFQSKDLTLSGSLLKPDTNEPTPAVVVAIGGGGDTYRYHWDESFHLPMWKMVSETLVNQGYSVLLVEKRGINYSEGHWENADFYDRADDIYAAIQYLKSRDDIIPDEIGLLGFSEGGRVGQIVASQYPAEVAFLILLSGPSVSIKEQVLYEAESDWICNDGLSKEEIAKKKESEEKKFNFRLGLSKIIKLDHYSRIIDFDPKNIIPEIQAPVFAIYGETDASLDPDLNAQLLKEGLKKGGNDQFQISIIPQANHWFATTERCGDMMSDTLNVKINPDLVETLSGFKEWYQQLK